MSVGTTRCDGELVEGAEHAAVQAAPLEFGEPPFRWLTSRCSPGLGAENQAAHG
jgi:hypothetical protein